MESKLSKDFNQLQISSKCFDFISDGLFRLNQY